MPTVHGEPGRRVRVIAPLIRGVLEIIYLYQGRLLLPQGFAFALRTPVRMAVFVKLSLMDTSANASIPGAAAPAR